MTLKFKRFMSIALIFALILAGSAPVLASGGNVFNESTDVNERGHQFFEVSEELKQKAIAANRVLPVSYHEYLRFDNFVIIENGYFAISKAGFLELTYTEIERLQEILNERNSDISYMLTQFSYYFVVENSIIMMDYLIQPLSGGVTRITNHWWGIRVYMSATAVNTMGAAFAIGVVRVPMTTVRAVLAGLGVQAGLSINRGIWFNAIVLPTPNAILYNILNPSFGWQ